MRLVIEPLLPHLTGRRNDDATRKRYKLLSEFSVGFLCAGFFLLYHGYSHRNLAGRAYQLQSEYAQIATA